MASGRFQRTSQHDRQDAHRLHCIQARPVSILAAIGLTGPSPRGASTDATRNGAGGEVFPPCRLRFNVSGIRSRINKRAEPSLWDNLAPYTPIGKDIGSDVIAGSSWPLISASAPWFARSEPCVTLSEAVWGRRKTQLNPRGVGVESGATAPLSVSIALTVLSHHSRQEALDGIGERRIPHPRPS
jgi:hypothetical protein